MRQAGEQLGSLPWFLAVVVCGLLALPARAQQTGTNFTGSTINQSGFIPPDTMGAVGPDHVVELINGAYAVYNKTDGSMITRVSLDTFWTNAGVPLDGSANPNFRFDPRIVYDAHSQRWFAAAVDNPRQVNNFVVAVSNSANPMDGWAGFAIDADTADTRWADFPMLGLNAEGVYLSANMFDLPGGQNESTAKTIVVIPKASLLDSTPSVAGFTRFEVVSGSDAGFSVQPVFDYTNAPMPHTLLSVYNIGAGVLKATAVQGPISAPLLDFTIPGIAVTPRSTAPSADQPGTKANINSGDTRFSGNVIRQSDSLWAVHTVNDTTTGNAALQWYEIDASTHTLVQQGLIADSELDLYYPSIAVNEFGDVVIGFSGSSETEFVSAFAVVGRTDQGTTTFGELMLLQAGLADYQRLDGSGRNRWGDYSATVLDPSDPYSFWTFQEFVSAEDVWAIQVTQILIPEPAAGVALLPTLLLLRRRRA